MPSSITTYGLMPLEDACEEFLKLLMFGKIKYPALAVSTTKELREVVLPKLAERANIIGLLPYYRIGHGLLEFPNDVKLWLFDSTCPDRVRGFQYDFLWAHNRGEWNHQRDFYDMLMFGLRLGDSPRIMDSK